MERKKAMIRELRDEIVELRETIDEYDKRVLDDGSDGQAIELAELDNVLRRTVAKHNRMVKELNDDVRRYNNYHYFTQQSAAV